MDFNINISILHDPKLLKIIGDYSCIKNYNKIQDFNVFTITSDLYYRENYHSDILKAFLEYRDNRTSKYPLLESFINMVNDSGRKIKVEDYKRPIVKREHHHIDILIKDEESKHCIIIENKINNAPDMERQLPRYYAQAEGEKLTIDAVVYLTKLPDMLPDKIGWKGDDEEKISNVFVSLPIKSTIKGGSLINWIDNSICKVNDIDVLSVLRQYRQLLNNIVYEMNELIPIIELNSALQNRKCDNVKIEDIIAMRDMLNRLSAAMATGLKNEISTKISTYQIGQWEPNSCVIQLQSQDRIYVYCELDVKAAYKVFVADFSKPNYNPHWIHPEDLEEYKLRLISNEKNKGIGFQFGYYEFAEVIKLIIQLLEIYNHDKS